MARPQPSIPGATLWRAPRPGCAVDVLVEAGVDDGATVAHGGNCRLSCRCEIGVNLLTAFQRWGRACAAGPLEGLAYQGRRQAAISLRSGASSRPTERNAPWVGT